jgi:hypothetical protein
MVLVMVVFGASCSRQSGPGTLKVRLTADLSRGSYIEGFIPFLRIERGTELISNSVLKNDGGLTWVTSRMLDPGSYQVTSYVRPCDANCGHLDAPTDTCSLGVPIQPGSQLEVRVILRPSHGCTMSRQ